MISPRERLAGALATYADHVALAQAAGVSAREMANAIEARPVNAIAYLRLCVAANYDPLPELPHARPPKPSDFDFSFFAAGFLMRRAINGHTDRQAGKVIDVAPATICRIESANVMSIGVVMRACRYIGVHPYGYCAVPQKIQGLAPTSPPRRKVSRETLEPSPV
jgi:DNA-binding XRE family transcriptional regulator